MKYNYLWELLDDIRYGIENMRREASVYQESRDLFDFVNQKERDYIDFKSLVCRLDKNTFLPDVIKYIKEKIRDEGSCYYGKTKFLGVATRGAEYFKLTQKLKKSLKFKGFTPQKPPARFHEVKQDQPGGKRAPLKGQIKM